VTTPESAYAAYEAIDAVRWSNLKFMRRSPKHYRYAADHPREDTPFFRLGRAVHVGVLEPDRLPLVVAVYKGKIRRGKEWDEFEAANADRTILKVDEYEMCCRIRDAVRAHPVARHLLEVGEAEKPLVWTDALTGLRCKGRIDWLNGIGLCDLKTSAQLSPRTFPAVAARYGYHCQLAFYQQGLRANGIEAPAKVLVVESEPPYDVGVFGVGEDALYAGEAEVRELLNRVAECTAKGEWPGQFGDGEVPLDLPPWAFPPEDDSFGGLDLVVPITEG
jgi:hypothetical protein